MQVFEAHLNQLPKATARIVFVSGVFCESLSILDSSVTITKADESSFEIALEKQAKTQPLQLIYLQAEEDVQKPLSIRVVLEAGAKWTLFDYYYGAHAETFSHQLELHLEPESSLETVSIHNMDIAQSVNVYQESNSHYQQVIIALSPDNLNLNQSLALQGQYASCKLYGIQYATQKQILKSHILVKHDSPHAESDILVKNIADDYGQVFFDGRVLVSKAAQHTLSEMNMHNRLLSNAALIDAKPELEIYADDVKCSHGATVGELSDDALFYLQARGICAREAKAMLMQAFLEEVANKISNVAMREHVTRLLLMKLEAHCGVGESQ